MWSRRSCAAVAEKRQKVNVIGPKSAGDSADEAFWHPFLTTLRRLGHSVSGFALAGRLGEAASVAFRGELTVAPGVDQRSRTKTVWNPGLLTCGEYARGARRSLLTAGTIALLGPDSLSGR